MTSHSFKVVCMVDALWMHGRSRGEVGGCHLLWWMEFGDGRIENADVATPQPQCGVLGFYFNLTSLNILHGTPNHNQTVSKPQWISASLRDLLLFQYNCLHSPHSVCMFNTVDSRCHLPRPPSCCPHGCRPDKEWVVSRSYVLHN